MKRTRKLVRRTTIVGALAAGMLVGAITVPAPAIGAERSSTGYVYMNTFTQGDFRVGLSADESTGQVCVQIGQTSSGVWHWGCGTAIVDVDDFMTGGSSSATTISYTEYTAGYYRGKRWVPAIYTSNAGTLTVSPFTWTGSGTPFPRITDVPDWYWNGAPCNPCVGSPGFDFTTSAQLERYASVTGSLTDSKWGTVSVSGGSGGMIENDVSVL